MIEQNLGGGIPRAEQAQDIVCPTGERLGGGDPQTQSGPGQSSQVHS